MMDFDALDDLPLRSQGSETLDWEEVKEDHLWEVPEEWWDQWGVADVLYRVGVDLPGEDLADQVWDELSGEYSTEDNAILCGGAAIERTSDTLYTVVSSGEDGLDSLIYAVNDVLLARVEELEEGADWVVTLQERTTT